MAANNVQGIDQFVELSPVLLCHLGFWLAWLIQVVLDPIDTLNVSLEIRI